MQLAPGRLRRVGARLLDVGGELKAKRDSSEAAQA